MSSKSKKSLANLPEDNKIIVINQGELIKELSPYLNKEKEILSKKEVIKLLDITPSILKRWQEDNVIPYVTIGEKGNERDFFKRSDINKLLNVKSN